MIGNRKKIGDSDTAFIFIIKPNKLKLVFYLKLQISDFKFFAAYFVLMCFSIKLVVFRDSQKGRDLGYEKGQTQIISYKSISKSLRPQGVRFSAGQSKLKKKKKKKDEKDSAPKLSISLSSTRACSCFDDI